MYERNKGMICFLFVEISWPKLGSLEDDAELIATGQENEEKMEN